MQTGGEILTTKDTMHFIISRNFTLDLHFTPVL